VAALLLLKEQLITAGVLFRTEIAPPFSPTLDVNEQALMLQLALMSDSAPPYALPGVPKRTKCVPGYILSVVKVSFVKTGLQLDAQTPPP
jgi:hypothetical protein